MDSHIICLYFGTQLIGPRAHQLGDTAQVVQTEWHNFPYAP